MKLELWGHRKYISEDTGAWALWEGIKYEGVWGGSANKVLTEQAQRPEFDPQNS